MKKAFIINKITSGYGLPQFLYLSKELEKLGYCVKIYEPLEKIRPFYIIDGYDRELIRNKFDLMKISIKIFKESYKQPIILVIGPVNIIYSLLSKKTLFIYNYIEIENIYNLNDKALTILTVYKYIKNKIKFMLISLYKKKVNYVIAPQIDRLKIAMKTYNRAKGFVVLNTAPLYEFKNKNIKDFSTPKLKVLYQGNISDISQFSKVINIIKSLSDICGFLIAGPCDNKYKNEIDILSRKKLIKYIGYVKSYKLKEIRLKSHIGLITWGNKGRAYKYAAPNKLFEYIMDGLFVISFNNYSIRKWNKKFKFGFVAENDEEDIIKHINYLYNNRKILNRNYKHNIKVYKTELNYENQISTFIEDLKNKANSI